MIFVTVGVQLPFDRLPVWKEFRALPLDEQRRKLRDPDLRRRLIEASATRTGRRAVGAEAREAEFDRILANYVESHLERRARIARWPRWRASAASTRPRS